MVVFLKEMKTTLTYKLSKSPSQRMMTATEGANVPVQQFPMYDIGLLSTRLHVLSTLLINQVDIQQPSHGAPQCCPWSPTTAQLFLKPQPSGQKGLQVF